MSGWTKLFSSIVTSSIWCEDDSTVRVWIAMLAVADADGVVEGSIPGFANLARVSVDQMRSAVAKLCSPDHDSRTPDNEGRRVEAIEGGWRILNYAAYREKGQAKEGSKAPAMRKYRARKRQEAETVTVGNALPAAVTGDPEERREKQEAEQITPPTPSRRGPKRVSQAFHPDTDETARRYVIAYNGSYQRRVGVLPTLREDLSRRLHQGYTPEQLVAVPILASAQVEYKQEPGVLLRTGENPRNGPDGRVTGAKNWIGDSLNKASGTVLWPHQVQAAEAAGAMDYLRSLGAKVSQ